LGGVTIVVLGVALSAGGALPSALGGLVAAYALVLAVVHEVLTAPVAWYRDVALERQFELSRPSTAAWLRDYLKSAGLLVAGGVCAAVLLVAAMRAWPAAWWLAAAVGAALLMGALTWLAPLLILPALQRSRPLGRGALRDRIVALSARAGVRVVDVREWALGGRSRRASAALAGAGATRRILLSDTLLADFSDDEIEVILAHELGHHVHGDVVEEIAARFTVLLLAFLAAAASVAAARSPFGYSSPSDPAALPLVALVVFLVSIAARPLLNALSRRHERRADRFALSHASRPDAFIAAMRRMAAQNMAEERPSKPALWLFHGHPPVAERLTHAEELISDSAVRQRRAEAAAGSR
jgi:STE24 endopeptidase